MFLYLAIICFCELIHGWIYEQLEEAATVEWAKLIDDVGPISPSIEEPIMDLPSYIEKWRMILWNNAYTYMFTGRGAYTKASKFHEFDDTDLLVKRVLLRYELS